MVGIIFVMGYSLMIKANCYLYHTENSNGIKASTLTFQSEERYPQTILYDFVTSFLSTESEQEKKVLVLGYDGFREDALENVLGMKQSAITMLKEQGGLYHSYAGAQGEQETSTAPGWLSILHGDWSYTLGVHNNDGIKPADATTFLKEAISMDYKATFIASWAPHFETTYRDDISDINNQVVYQQMQDDAASIHMLNEVLGDTSDSSFDVIFSTLEYSDHAGHEFGYGNLIEAYVQASKEVDNITYDLMQAIHNRSTYQEEDWLIIITTDHGGIGTGHGGQQAEERNTWFVMNKDITTLL